MTRSELEGRLRELHAEWAPLLGLDAWEDRSYVAEEDDGVTWAEGESLQWEYARFRIKYYPLLGTRPEGRVEETVVHELVHVLLAPTRQLLMELLDLVDEDETETTESLRRLAIKLDEKVTTDLTTVLLRLRRAGPAHPSVEGGTLRVRPFAFPSGNGRDNQD